MAFAIDLALPAVAVNKVKHVARVSGAIGNAPGMALGGAVRPLLLLAPARYPLRMRYTTILDGEAHS